MNTSTVEKAKRNVRVAGVSFDPEIWDYLNEEVERQGHRNRSLVIEKALRYYREHHTDKPRKAANGRAS